MKQAMNIEMTTPSFLIHLSRYARHRRQVLVALSFLVLSQIAKAVAPAPDGGYPGGNTAEGTSALLSRTTGTYNTAVGIYSILSLTDGNFNTGIGAAALLVNTGDNNTATGAGALLSNSTGSANTADGSFVLFSNTTGNFNTANGYLALQNNTTGSVNTANGANALFHNTTGASNTGTGVSALFANTIGTNNTASGYLALLSNTIGEENTAAGANALFSNTEGFANTANGFSALSSNTTGTNNTADGEEALASNMTGINNTAVGVAALPQNTSGGGNIALGYLAGFGVATADNVIAIGADGADVSNSCYIGHIAGQTVGAGGTTCYVDNDGKLGVILSARRFKTDIAVMAVASESILALRPVTFHYKPELDKTGIPQFGLVAEEVAKVNPELVTHDGKGELNTVRYEAVNAMLLNEFLKEHRKVESQEATITQLKAAAERQAATTAQQHEQIEALTAGLQKVTAQIEAGRPAPKIVLSNHL